MNDYYVYIYWRLDTNEPFYVGKGKGYRITQMHNRNKHFKNILNNIPVAVEKFKDNLTNEEANGIECWLINELVFEYGFSIDIKNNYSVDHYCHLVNMTWGGEGTRGHNYRDGMSKEALEDYDKKHSEYCKKIFSIKENNPMFGKHGKDNKNSKSVICLTTKKIFYSTKEAGEYYNCDSSGISKCCRKDKNKQGYTIKSVGKYKGQNLVWRYIKWNHDKKFRIK